MKYLILGLLLCGCSSGVSDVTSPDEPDSSYLREKEKVTKSKQEKAYELWLMNQSPDSGPDR